MKDTAKPTCGWVQVFWLAMIDRLKNRARVAQTFMMSLSMMPNIVALLLLPHRINITALLFCIFRLSGASLSGFRQALLSYTESGCERRFYLRLRLLAGTVSSVRVIIKCTMCQVGLVETNSGVLTMSFAYPLRLILTTRTMQW